MKKKKPGFTLLETIIGLTLTVVIIGIASSMFIRGNKVFSDSDVNTTLQIEGQTIQEKISDIAMQATGIKSVAQPIENSSTNEIDNILINSYYKTTEAAASVDLRIEKKDTRKVYKDGSKVYELWIGNQLVSSNVKSMAIDTNVITASNNNTLKNINSVEFNILLRKENGYSNVEQALNFRATFRNK